MLKKHLLSIMAMVFLMLLPMIIHPVIAIVPTYPTGAGGDVNAPGLPGGNTLVEDVPYGGGPTTLDPAAAYDSASLELLQNAYDRLINFDGEQAGNVPNSGVSNEYLPSLATQVTVEPAIPGVSPPWTDFTVLFTIRGTNPSTGVGTVPFQTWSRSDLGLGSWSQYYLTAQDVAYTFDRLLVHSYAFEGNYWLLTDALLLQDTPPTSSQTAQLEGAVQYNNYQCWFNIPQPGFASGAQPSFTPVNMFVPYPYTSLNSALTSTNAYTSLNVAPLMQPIPLGTPLTLVSGSNSQDVVTASVVPAGATTIPVEVFTANFNYPSGTTVNVQDGLFNLNFWNSLPTNIDYPLNTFFQVWAQPWASIVSYDWTVGWLNPQLTLQGVPSNEMEWTFGPTYPGSPTPVSAPDDWSTWTSYFNPPTPIYDEVTGTIAGAPGVTCGTGPYILETYNPAEGAGNFYLMTRFYGEMGSYWGGWPASWPNPPYPNTPMPWGYPADTRPQGWVDNFEVIQESSAAQGIANLAAGTADFAPVPLSLSSSLFTGSPYGPTSPLVIDDPTVPGIQCNYPIPTLETESFFMNQAIVSTGTANTYGEIDGPASSGSTTNFSPTGIPSNFFSDINVRMAFAYAIDYTFYIQDQFLGRGYQPITCAPDGFPYINTGQSTYSLNTATAAADMANAWGGVMGLTSFPGFTVDLVYPAGNSQWAAMMGNLAGVIYGLAAQNGLTAGTYNAVPTPVSWSVYVTGLMANELPAFMGGWQADYSGLQDFMFAYMDSNGFYASHTGYSNTADNGYLQNAAYTNVPAQLQSDYYALESDYYSNVPSVTLMVPVGTGFQRDWVQGHYYNPLYPGIYAYNLWKYNAIPGDVNRDGKVDFSDVIDVLHAFGSYYGQLGTGGGYWPIMQARWNFYAGVIGEPLEEWTDRKIDMGSVVTTLMHYSQVDTPSGMTNDPVAGNGQWQYGVWYGVP